MRAVLREKALERLLQVPSLIDLHKQHSSSFIDQLLEWFSETEKALQPLRSPLVSRLATLRGQLLSADEGILHPQVSNDIRSMRKRRNALAIILLQSAEVEIREEVDKIDSIFEGINEKLAQLIAIVSSQTPLPLSLHLTEGYLDTIWMTLRSNKDTESMSIYIEAQTDLTDRRYLLQSLMANLQPSPAPYA